MQSNSTHAGRRKRKALGRGQVVAPECLKTGVCHVSPLRNQVWWLLLTVRRVGKEDKGLGPTSKRLSRIKMFGKVAAFYYLDDNLMLWNN
ncbi:rCG30512 [Rattus norvegicus]|uniref:RCG30512 n=1 Tax=Rattus norvegicus TaxID=10116 RepID=A6JFF9_RAT|nr:rCG30512 [Rattus norvegicus]